MKHINSIWPLLALTIVAAAGSFLFVGKDFALLVFPIGIALSIISLEFIKKAPTAFRVIAVLVLLVLLSFWFYFVSIGGASRMFG